MGAAPSAEVVDFTKKTSAFDVDINRQLVDALRPHPELAGLFRTATRVRPIPGTDSFDLTSTGPPAGNDLYELFLARLDDCEARPVQRRQAQERATRRWQLIARSTRVVRAVIGRLRTLHRLGFAHGDVKPENAVLMAGPDGTDQVALIDFDMACRLDPESEARWTDAHHRLYNAACVLDARFRQPPVHHTDEAGNPLVSAYLSPPTPADDMWRALCNYHRLIVALDPGVVDFVSWPDSALYGAGGRVERLLNPEAEGQFQGQHAGPLGRLVFRAASGEVAAEAELARHLERRRVGPGVLAHLDRVHTLGMMMLQCFNVVGGCAPSDRHKAQAWSTLTQLFDPTTVWPARQRPAQERPAQERRPTGPRPTQQERPTQQRRQQRRQQRSQQRRQERPQQQRQIPSKRARRPPLRQVN